ncbi:BatA domain-containing protein [Hymenobacter perfusus]|uniref:BatA domain-containing protein n=1 Tax=Hymenobacter perfusus TaxID=1236770 RepID=UPI001FE9CA80|nr:BatA domain-containing protein [Hymenobacter perfusus]
MLFTHPWFLLGLLAIVIPVAIHLFELRRPQRIMFSNVEFIREVKLVTARQRRIKNLLVLLSRVGLIVALALLFAQPYIPAPEKIQTNNTAVRVLLDDSPSMQQTTESEQSVLEYAIEQSVELPLAFPPTTRYWVWPGKQEALNAASYRVQVEQTQISGQGQSLATTLLQATQQSGRVAGPLFVFSDFQKNGLTGSALTGLDTAQQIFLVPLAGKPGPNVFVDSVWLDDAFVRTGSDLTVRVRLRNGGQLAAENTQIKLFIGKQQAASFQLSIPAQKAVTTSARVRLLSVGAQACRVEVADHPVDFDNAYYFTLQPAQQIRITEVGNEAQLGALYTNEPLFSYQFTPAQAADYRKLATANLLVLREAAAVGAGLRENLRRAVQQGATLVIVPAGSTNSRESYGQLFKELGLGTVQWQPNSSTGPVLQDIALPSAQNPFFRDVFAGVNPRAGMPKAAPVLRWARSGTEVLRLRDGEGYLAGFPSGKGQVYVFTAPFSAPYSDFAQHPLFVPVLYRLAMQSYQQEQQPAYRLNQGVVNLRLPKAAGSENEPAYRLVQDSLTYIPVQQLVNGVLRLEVPPGMRRPGFYTLQINGKTLATLAFNLDKRESDLRSYSASELRQLIGPNRPNIQVYETGQNQTVAARYKAQRVGVPLWQYCLWAALGFLLLEGLLLRWNRRAAPVASPAMAA